MREAGRGPRFRRQIMPNGLFGEPALSIWPHGRSRVHWFPGSAWEPTAGEALASRNLFSGVDLSDTRGRASKASAFPR